MAYLIKAGAGLVLFFGSIVVFNLKLVELLEVGTCASGGPYEISRPCPEGVGTDIVLLTASVFTGLIGAGIFAFRGDPPWGRRRPGGNFLGLGAAAWGIFFTATGATMLYTALANDTVGSDGELGAMITAVTFLLMGAPVLAIVLWSAVRGLGGRRDESPATSVSATGALGGGGAFGRMRTGMANVESARGIGETMKWGSAGGYGTGGAAASADTIGKIERLQKLRESGAITDVEFEREKAKILAG